MRYLDPANPTQFYIIGLSYKKTNAEIRGRFSIQEDKQKELLHALSEHGVTDSLLISTCNRTEIYGSTDQPEVLFQLLADHTTGDISLLKEIAYIHKGKAAIDHIFKVGCGLDSQIIGDFEVIAQVKKSHLKSRLVSPKEVFLDRLISHVIQASRRVKFETQLSTGITSVSYAGVQFIRDTFEDLNQKKSYYMARGN